MTEVETALNEIYRRVDPFLFGRWTYECLSPWFVGNDSRVHARVRDRTGLELEAQVRGLDRPQDPQWADTTLLSGDLADAVGELKAKPEGELLVPGGGTLIRWLLVNDLVDEISLFLAPVVIGQGTRLFPETGPDIGLELVESQATSNGVIDADLPNDRTPAVRNDARHDARLERVEWRRTRLTCS